MRRLSTRGILAFVVAFVVVFATATWAAAQCAYPALELLEFDYVNRPQMIHQRTDGHSLHSHIAPTALQMS